jgi:hypothetical protein
MADTARPALGPPQGVGEAESVDPLLVPAGDLGWRE